MDGQRCVQLDGGSCQIGLISVPCSSMRLLCASMADLFSASHLVSAFVLASAKISRTVFVDKSLAKPSSTITCNFAIAAARAEARELGQVVR